MSLIRLAHVGCGGMGLRHMYGLIELKAQGFDTFELAAVCDLHASAASYLADFIETELGSRPKVYTDFDDMLEKEPGLEAVNIVTDTRMHHVFALKAFEADKHVAVEKPMGLTVRACQRMIEAARKAGKTLSISENYRRDPMNRLVKAVLESGAIGKPRLMVNLSLGGGRSVQQIAAWRHLKLRGGWGIEFGVHTSDLILYFMGDVDRVYAETEILEPIRHMTDQPSQLSKFYVHRVREDIDQSGTFEATAEDTAFAVLRFASGALGHLGSSIAAPGQRLGASMVYGSEGSLKLPASRSGRPVEVTMGGREKPLTEQEVLALVPDYEIDDVTARFFDGIRRPPSYQMPFELIDRKLIAIELQDFAEAIVNSREPECTGQVGLDAVALSYAILESGHLRQPVQFHDVASDTINDYQREINHYAGLL